MTPRIVCIHHTDPDGWCSAAIVRHLYWTSMEAIDFVPIPAAYSDPPDKFLNQLRSGDLVFVVDFSLKVQGSLVAGLEAIHQITGQDVWWIDHHDRIIQDWRADEWRLVSPDGTDPLPWFHLTLRTDCSACRLTWEVLFPLAAIPEAVQMISDYDSWKKDLSWFETEAIPFHTAVASGELATAWTPPDQPDFADLDVNPEKNQFPHPFSPVWRDLFHPDRGPALVKAGVRIGSSLVRFERSIQKMAAKRAIRTRFAGHDAVVIVGVRGSNAFGSLPDHDSTLLLAANPVRTAPQDTRWEISIYYESEDLHCGDLAARHGGSGHPGAAGFTCSLQTFVDLLEGRLG